MAEVKEIRNKYRSWYYQIIARARGRKLKEFERHHVRPKSLGGANCVKNIVDLTYREHFLVHWLFVKFTTGDDRRKMALALHSMRWSRDGSRSISGWQYEIAKKYNLEGVRLSWTSPEYRAKQITAMRKAWARPGYREKMSVVQSKTQALPENVKKNREGVQRAHQNDPTIKIKQSIASKNMWADPEFKKKMFGPTHRARLSAAAQKRFA